jgi:hypothetical protein
MLVSAHSDGRLKLWDVSRSAGVTSSYNDRDDDHDDDDGCLLGVADGHALPNGGGAAVSAALPHYRSPPLPPQRTHGCRVAWGLLPWHHMLSCPGPTPSCYTPLAATPL